MTTIGVRNVYYLRISAHTILTTVLYLDQRHVRWLNEQPHIWQRAVHELLRPRMRAYLAQAMHTAGNAEKPQVCEADTFRLLFYLQDMDRAHSVLLKFPGASPTEPVPDAPVSLANAPVPPASSPPRAASPALPAVKEEPLDDGEPLFIPDSDGEEDTAPTYAALDEDEAKYKPKVHVSYAGFTVFGKELVCVLEPTAEVVAANPALFEVDDDGTRKEQRQLDVHAKRQWDRPSVSQRQYGREAPAASHAHREDTPLFRGLTPATDNEF